MTAALKKKKTFAEKYSDLHKNIDCRASSQPEVNEFVDFLEKSLIQDLNTAIESMPFGDKEWYLLLLEKKDLMFPDAFKRTIYHSLQRPYPEDDTLVFWHSPRKKLTKLCWCLPSAFEMKVIKSFDDKTKHLISCWKKHDLKPFGFVEKNGEWVENPNHEDLVL